MSYSHEKDSHSGPEWTNSPKTNRSNATGQETLFEFFKQKSRRDLDRSFSSARKSRRRSEIPESPNVKLLKELNSSSSPNKKRLPPSHSPRPITTNPLRMPSPLKATDARLYTSKEESESPHETREQETPSTPGPLFIRLIQSGARTRTKPDVPNVPKPNRRFSATLPKDGNRLRESDTLQLNGRLETGTMEDFSCLNMNTKSTFVAGQRNSPPRRSPRTPSPHPKRSPARSPSPTNNEIKLFGERHRGVLAEASIISYIQDYEQKFTELSNYVQKQVKQVSRLTQVLQRDQEECDFFQLRIWVDDLGLTTMAASKMLNDGLLEVAEVLELLDRTEQRHRHEVRELNDALEHSRTAVKGGKDENQEKLEDLLSYIEGLKGKQSFSIARERKSYNEDSRWRHNGREHVDTEAHELEKEKMRENIAQMRGVIQSLEAQVKELKRENMSYKEQNISLKDDKAILKKESEALRKEAEVLKHDLNAILLTQEREERDEFRRTVVRSPSKGNREKRAGSRSRQSSPIKTAEKGMIKKMQDPEIESLKTEVEYLKYKANTLAKDNEDLIKRLTDKVLIEREMKVLKVKVQEMAEIVHTKTKDNETLWKVIKEAKDKLGVNGGSAFSLICKQNGLDDRNRGKIIHW